MRHDFVQLRGITWDHTRGLLPMVATAQRYHELHPYVEITWHKRSLQAFGDQPVEVLAEQFDLLVIDHPFVGYAAANPLLVPLETHLGASYLVDQAEHSVGGSHASYSFGGHQWALAIDAATPVSSCRPDLLERHDVESPRTWEDLIVLARCGLVAVPAIPIDSLMNLYMLCVALGQEPFDGAEFIGDAVGTAALETLRELITLCDPTCLERNPIRTYEAMTQSDEIAYCPFAYGYANYATLGYARSPLRFGGLVSVNSVRLRSTLGGTGLAVSARVSGEALAAALNYARFVASPEVQRGLYLRSGGQPGHRLAWADDDANLLTQNYFCDTITTLDGAYQRPRYDGYMDFQDHAGDVVHQYLREGGRPQSVLDNLNRLYHQSRIKGGSA